MRESQPTDQEVFESIPWEELRDLGDTSRRRRIWILVGGAALVAVIIFSVARTFSAPDPRITPVATTAVAPAPIPSPPPTEGTLPALPPPQSAEIPKLPSEADLMADLGIAVEEAPSPQWQPASYAEWFVLEFFTLDGSDHPPERWEWLGNDPSADPSDALSYVEWVRALQVESLGDGRWRTEVALRRLVSTDGVGYSRLPTQAVEVVVDLGNGVPAVVDLPRFIPLPEADPGQWWLGEPREAPPAAVVRTAREQMARSGAGTADGEPRISRTGEAWRVEWVVTDQAGISWPVSLWIGPEGTPVPAGG